MHIDDICQAIIRSLQVSRNAIHNQTLNVGSTQANYQIREIAEIVAEVFPNCTLEVGPSGGDNRSYRVNCDKIGDVLKGFECRWTPEDGARQLLHVFERIDMPTERFEFRAFTRLHQLKYLQETGQLDREFFWKAIE